MKIYDRGLNGFQSHFMAFIFYLVLSTLSLAKADVYVLSLHRVGANGGLTLSMSEKDLELRIQILLDQGYRFITLEISLSETTSSEKLAAITFDDGYEDVYTHAFPVLKRLSVPATAFVITESVGQDGFMNWDQLNELKDAGWAIGSHTVSHADLKMLTPVSIQQELDVAQQALREHRLYSSDCLAYPYGQYDQRVQDITHQYHSCAFATGAGLNDFRTDSLSYNRPLVLPFGVSWQAQGNDIRSLLFAESMLYWVLPPLGEKTVPKAFYHPSRFAMLGAFEFSISYQNGNIYQDFFYRENNFAVSTQVSRLGQAYTEVSAIWGMEYGAIGIGWSSYGPVFGVSLDLFNYGELWFKLGLNGNMGVGLALIPFDYTLLQIELNGLSRFNSEVLYALPLFIDQGRPVRLIVGFDENLYGGINGRLGGFELSATVSANAQLSFRFKSTW